jgi:hypothetical protein
MSQFPNISAFSAVFFLAFFLILGYIVFTALRGLGQWNKNNNSPVLTVEAKVVTKRISVSEHHNAGNDSSISNATSTTTYFTTFEVESGDRMELKVPGGEYGMLVEGDAGRLTFQGTRYKNFDRRI